MKSVCLAAAIVFVAMPGARATQSSQSMQVAAGHHHDVSAARKKVQRKAAVIDSRSPYYLRPGVKPSFGYIGPPGYAGEYAWRKSIGQCVEDLGYGRWSPCGQR